MNDIRPVFNVCLRLARKHREDERKKGFRLNIWVEACEFFAVPADESPLASKLKVLVYNAIDCTESRGITNKIRKARLAYFKRERTWRPYPVCKKAA